MPFSLYRKGRKDKESAPPDVFIAVPCVSGRPCANFVMSMIDSADYLARANITFDFWLHTEDCHVDDSRNFLVQQFMQSGAKTMVFIDDDVGWATEDLVRLLLYKDVDVVGGAYPLKQRAEDYPIRIRSDIPHLQARPDGLLEVEGIPTGFMRIERHVIEKLSEKRKHLWFTAKEAKEDDPKLQIIFERMMVNGNRWSGDLNFCREARLLGMKVHVAPEMTFTHQGQQRWEGNLGNYLRRKQGILDPRLDAAMERLITGDSSPEVFNEIFKWHGEEWSMGPRGMSDWYHACLEAKGPILEVGSGLTTILGGIACMRNGQMVHALEHDLSWFQHVRNWIQLWKVKPIALYYAPLQEYPGDLLWYEIDESLPKKFDVALIDGPPRRYGREGVYKLLMDRIKDAKWIIDDVDDPVQLKLAQKYAEQEGKKLEDVGDKISGRRRHAIVT